MECKHPYYHYVDGKLLCTQCGEPSPKQSKVEDKIGGQGETKEIIKPAHKKK